jgi:hypothetical protein
VVGFFDGLVVGFFDGLDVGFFDGLVVGFFVGLVVGFFVGLGVGFGDGDAVGVGVVSCKRRFTLLNRDISSRLGLLDCISGNEFVTFDSVSAETYSGNRKSHVIKYKIDGMIK